MRIIINCPATMVTLAVAALVAGCGESGERDREGRLPVVATTMQLQDFTRQVGGERVRVTGILTAETDPHDYEPTPSDADAVGDARLVVANGVGLDAWLNDLLAQAGADAVRIDAAADVRLLPTEEDGFPGDPHVWHDPDLAKRMIEKIAAGLGKADPPGRETYERNADALKSQIDSMAATVRREFADVPRERRDLVTSHDAFGYFARAYDVNVLGSVLPSVTTDSEPSARQLRELVDEIRANQVGTIFTEEAVEPRLERRIAEESGARVSTSLYADTLGPTGSPEATYVGAELANARAMRLAWEAR